MREVGGESFAPSPFGQSRRTRILATICLHGVIQRLTAACPQDYSVWTDDFKASLRDLALAQMDTFQVKKVTHHV